MNFYAISRISGKWKYFVNDWKSGSKNVDWSLQKKRLRYWNSGDLLERIGKEEEEKQKPLTFLVSRTIVEWIKDYRTLSLEAIFKTVNAKLRGHYQYYGVTDNTREVKNYLLQIKWLLFEWLNWRSQRKSQRKSYTLNSFYKGLLITFLYLNQVSR
ncbi:group II intron maturase-specific domain-containing protein [Clostridium sp. chh4-2]|uniref:group II intron maturase-specific domain-containing protein n=1 Tax=Clostridium sp. chh4-2 TaxID=2067550 RepID=UPI00325BE467